MAQARTLRSITLLLLLVLTTGLGVPSATAAANSTPVSTAADLLSEMTAQPGPRGLPLFPGVVGLITTGDNTIGEFSAGQALRYADRSGTPLPAEQQIPMRKNTIFDLASLTKLFTSVAAAQLIEQGKLSLEGRVTSYLPEFSGPQKDEVTIQQLLTHTSGLNKLSGQPLWQYPDQAARRLAVVTTPLSAAPGSSYIYSDLNMIVLGFIVEKLTGQSLDQVIQNGITKPLGMDDTMFNPPAELKPRIAATEYQETPNRGLVWGQVHDEKAWALGGIAGSAGLFSTADDLARFGRMILNGGSFEGATILAPETVKLMLTNYNARFPGSAQGLGFELDQSWYMGLLTSPQVAGHTGFTGTSIVIDPVSKSLAILLTNRVHPNRNGGSINTARRLWSSALALSLPGRTTPASLSVTPASSDTAGTVTVSGADFIPYAKITLDIATSRGAPSKSLEVQADSQGRFQTQVAGPGELQPDAYTVTSTTLLTSDITASFTIAGAPPEPTVTTSPPEPSLPVAGQETLQPAVTGSSSMTRATSATPQAAEPLARTGAGNDGKEVFLASGILLTGFLIRLVARNRTRSRSAKA